MTAKKTISAIKTVLLAACESVTAALRSPEAPVGLNDEQTARLARVKGVLETHDFGCQSAGAVALLAAGLNAPELNSLVTGEDVRQIPPLAVVKLVGNESGHTYGGSLYIAMNDGRLLARNGARGRRITVDEVVIATPEEVETCIDTLSNAQLQRVQNDRVFTGILAAGNPGE